MGHDLLFHALLLLGVLWFCVILRWVWPRRRAALDQADGQPATRTYRRSADLPPFPGLTTRPLCATCEQAAQAHVAQAPSGPPPLMTSTRGRRRQVATQHQFCPHPCCRYYGWVGRGNIRANGHPGGGPWRQWSCVACGAYFLETHGTPLHGHHVPAEWLVHVVAALAEGLGVRAVARVFEVDPNTVLAWLVEAADHLEAFFRFRLHDVQVSQVQLDKLYAVLSAVKASQMPAAEAIGRLERSPHWVWGAIDPITKLLLALDSGDRTLEMAQRVVHHVAEVLAPGCIPLCLTDGFKDYATALLTHFGCWVQPPRRQPHGPTPKPRWMPRPALLYAQVVKQYRRRRVVRVRHRVVFGTLARVTWVLAATGWQINTAFIERVNGAIRQHVAAVGRRVITLCKNQEGVRHQLALYHGYDNFCLPHTSLRRALPQPLPTNGTGSARRWQPCTPAMAAGLTDHVWSLKEVLLCRVPPWPQPQAL
jgi:transposase-like protein/IS1 family transposase